MQRVALAYSAAAGFPKVDPLYRASAARSIRAMLLSYIMLYASYKRRTIKL
jgi:hypothetical protein